jgi:AraC-like DNA-binding protein
VDIIFSFGDISSKSWLEPMLPNIIGTMTTYIQGYHNDLVCMLGIRFKPAGFTAFTRIPINEFTNQRVNLTLVKTLFDEQFYIALPGKKLMEDKLLHIDTYFVHKLSRLFNIDRQVEYAVTLIQQTNGLLPLTAIANESCLSLRHFERRFKAAVGISPKNFSKIIKLKHTISYLQEHKSSSLLAAAIDCGYYDHAHLIKELRAFSGNTPSYYKK